MRYFLYDVLNDYSIEKVSGKSDFGTLAHAKARGVKDNRGKKVFWSDADIPPRTHKQYFGRNKHKELIYLISTHGLMKNPVVVGTEKYLISPAKLKRVKAAAKFAGRSITWQSVAARPSTVDAFLAKVEPAMKAVKERKKMHADKRLTKKRKKNPEHEIRELILFAENSPSLHNQYVSIMKNLSRKKQRGIYDPVLAAKLWKYWIDEGVKQYNKEILGGGHSLKQNVFTVADRKQAAIEMEDQEQEEVFGLEYLHNPKRRKTMARKKKRSAKQLANDRRLGRMAKARAKAKRGGRRKVTRKKTTRSNPHKKRTASKKSHLWNIFKCYGKSVRFLGLTTAGKLQWTIRDAAMIWKSKDHAAKIAKKVSTKRGMANYHIGVSSRETTSAQIASQCNAGK